MTGATINLPGFGPAESTPRDSYDRMTDALSSYRGANVGPASTPWMPSPTDPRMRYVPGFDLARMRDRARQLQRNNAIAAGVIQQFTQNVVGTGFVLQPATADPEWNKRAAALMEDWFPSADTSGMTWLEHQRAAFMASVRDGDVATVLLDDGSLQMLEGDLICSKPGQYFNAIDGVTIGPRGRPTSFSFRTVGLNGKWAWQQIDAIDVIFLARTNRPGQVRGEPVQAATFDLYDQLDEFIEALLMACRAAACTSLVINRNDATGAVQSMTEAERRAREAVPPGAIPPPGDRPGQPGGRRREMKMGPAMVHVLNPGETISQLNPAQPSHNFPALMEMILRLIGLPLGMPLEMVLLDVSKVSGPTARAAINAATVRFATEQRIFTDRYLKRTYRWRMSKFIKAGAIEYRPDFFNHRWVPPRRPLLDPKGDMLARQLQYDVGETTLTEQLQQQGHDFATWVAQRKAEIDAMREAGIPVLYSQAFTTGAGPVTPPPPNDGTFDDVPDDTKDGGDPGGDEGTDVESP